MVSSVLVPCSSSDVGGLRLVSSVVIEGGDMVSQDCSYD